MVEILQAKGSQVKAATPQMLRLDQWPIPTAYVRKSVTQEDRELYFLLKRISDIVCSFLLLVILSPLFLLIALLIKLDSSGPVIFRQDRVGYDWRRQIRRKFVFLKFRSMTHNCDQSLHEQHIKQWIRGEGGAGGADDLVKLTNDPRVTRVGKFLRKTSLDELPQLWNVLMGHMSLVGPRPVPLYEAAEYRIWHYRRLEAPAGITGLWQVYGRGQVGVDEMARLDMVLVSP